MFVVSLLARAPASPVPTCAAWNNSHLEVFWGISLHCQRESSSRYQDFLKFMRWIWLISHEKEFTLMNSRTLPICHFFAFLCSFLEESRAASFVQQGLKTKTSFVGINMQYDLCQLEWRCNLYTRCYERTVAYTFCKCLLFMKRLTNKN
jgi:hypothetical protein